MLAVPNNEPQTLGQQRHGRARGWQFGVSFALTATALLGLYYFPYPRGSVMQRVLAGYLHHYAWVSGSLLRLLEPNIIVSGQDILGRYSVRIVKTCDGMDVNILLFSAIMAWPCVVRRRVAAAAIGVAVLFVVNTSRICSLYLIGVYAPASFELVHLELWPVLILIVAVIFFLLFIRDAEGRAAART